VALGYTSRADALKNIDRWVTNQGYFEATAEDGIAPPKHDLF